jgi:hypothetical protein
MQNTLLSTAYFPPVGYFQMLAGSGKVYIEQFEHFNKQTYRNRCTILAANGPINLVVPVVKGRGPKTFIRDLRVSYDMNWQINHWRTIFSAYKSSPFFEYYADDIHSLFKTKHEFLFDLNRIILAKLLGAIEIDVIIEYTSDFEKAEDDFTNLREIISPKNNPETNELFFVKPYTQVFKAKHGFVSNLSILDLLFNEGPNTISFLEKKA